MPTLALMEQGMTLAVESEQFPIEREGAVVSRVRMAEVDEVLVFGAISLTPAAIAALLQRGIDTVFLTAHGRYRGRLVGKPGRNIELRVAQFERVRDPAVAVPLARSLVGGKVANQRYILLRAQREQKREDLVEAIGSLRRLLGAIDGAGSVEVVRGLEGQGAAVYFGAFGKCIRNPEFSFTKRTRRPPRDPVNAMLSFGYTLLGTVMESSVLRAGLDPMLGVFHTPEYGRPSLMLDLIEEFRPVVVDALTLRVVNRREVAAEDFEELHDDAELAAVGDEEGEAAKGSDRPACASSHADRAVWLGPTGRRVFFRAWGRRLRETHFYPVRQQTLTLEEIMQQQVYQLARLLKGEAEQYQAFVLR
jgi:CRISPR-associated protein Cas1